MSADANNYIIL